MGSGWQQALKSMVKNLLPLFDSKEKSSFLSHSSLPINNQFFRTVVLVTSKAYNFIMNNCQSYVDI